MIYKRLFYRFNFYILLLFALNIFHSITAEPMTILTAVGKWTSGEGLCALYNWTSWYCHGLLRAMHVNIAFNRTWALLFPLHYRSYSTTKSAIVLNVVSLGFVMVMMTPYQILMFIINPLNLEKDGCGPNIGWNLTYSRFIMVTIMDLGNLLPVAVYPIVCFKYFSRKFNRINVVSQNVYSSGQNTAGQSIKVKNSDNESKTSKDRFLHYTLYTISLLLLWTPLNLEYTLALFGVIDYDLCAPQYKLAFLLFYAQGVLDPIFFGLVVKDIRVELTKLFRLFF